jgi:hypothetical protein
MEHIRMPIDEIAEKIDKCVNVSGVDIEPEEVVTILSMAYPGYNVYYADDTGDLLSGVMEDINIHGLVFDYIDFIWIDCLQLYFLIQKTHYKN